MSTTDGRGRGDSSARSPAASISRTSVGVAAVWNAAPPRASASAAAATRLAASSTTTAPRLKASDATAVATPPRPAASHARSGNHIAARLPAAIDAAINTGR